jgi:hypothetical protein
MYTYHMPGRQQEDEEADAHENRLPRPLHTQAYNKHVRTGPLVALAS